MSKIFREIISEGKFSYFLDLRISSASDRDWPRAFAKVISSE